MRFISTRGRQTVTGPQAILQGIAPDGGLYVPVTLPKLTWDKYLNYSYHQLTADILSLFFDEFSPETITWMVQAAYQEFPQTVAQIQAFDDTAVLELFHGPTLAFKDFALCLLPYLLLESAKLEGRKEKICIVTATSGDTGKAAMSGFRGVHQTEVVVFYPNGGVSPIQEQQMLTESAENVVAFALEGTFDDAQTGVKKLFQDQDFIDEMAGRGRFLSSANSINIGRLVPQLVYYIYSYLELVRRGNLEPGELLDVSVPTGNFGNILAAVYARDMGLPLGRIICASNDNHVLSDFFQTGSYSRQRSFLRTSSPSMDILISSNLERYLARFDKDQSHAAMTKLQLTGGFHWTQTLDVVGDWVDERAVSQTINSVFHEHKLALDPHSAIAWAIGQKLRQARYLLVVATASPFKFPDKVLSALGIRGEGVIELAKVIGQDVPQNIRELAYLDEREKVVVTENQMTEIIGRWMDDSDTRTSQFG